MKTLMIIIALFYLLGSLSAQVKIMAKPGEICHLNELGAIVILDDDEVRVEFVMPAENRLKAYMNVDLKSADEILMVNGKKVKTPVDIEKIYKDLRTGEEIKLGIRRDGNLMIVSYNKADPEDLPERKMMRLKVVDEGDGVQKSIIDEDGTEHVIEGDSIEINGEKMSIKDLKDKHVKIRVKEDDEI